MAWFRPVGTVLAAVIVGALCSAPAAAETTSQYASIIHAFNPKMQTHQTQKLALEVIRDAQRAHLDARLLVALVTVESRWRQSAISHAGARGLGQLMPQTARLMGVNPRDSRENLLGASRYLGAMLRQFGSQGDRLHLAIAAYNAGPLAIRRAKGIPDNGETPTYVRRVIAVWHSLRERVADAARATTDTYIAAMPVAPYADIVSLDELEGATSDSDVATQR